MLVYIHRNPTLLLKAPTSGFQRPLKHKDLTVGVVGAPRTGTSMPQSSDASGFESVSYTQRLQNPLMKEYTLNYTRVPIIVES